MLAPGAHPLQPFGMLAAEALGNDGVQGLPPHLVRGVPEHLGRSLVPEHDLPVRVDRYHRVVGRIEDGPEALLGEPERPVHLGPGRDVPDDPREEAGSVVVDPRSQGELYGELGPVRPQAMHLDRLACDPRLPGLDDPGHPGLVRLAEAGRDDLGE